MDTSASNTDRIRRRLLISSTILVALISSIVAVSSIVPFYNRLKEKSRSDLKHICTLQNLASEQYFSHISSIAWQITSRTRIRQELIEYNNGEISLASVTEFSEPKLEDAIRPSPEVAGMVRFDKNGQPVALVGEEVPQKQWVFHPPDNGSVLFGKLSHSDTGTYLPLSAPILDRDGTFVGSDLVLFNLDGLEHIVSGISENETIEETLVLVKTGGALQPVFPPRELVGEPVASITGISARTQLLPASDQVLFRVKNSSGDYDVVAAGELSVPGWVLAVRMEEENLYRAVNRQLRILAGAIILLVVAGSAVMYYLLRPLAGRILVHSQESENTYRSLVETTDTGYCIIDREGNVIDGNDEYVRISGHESLTDILGRNVIEWTAPYHKEKNTIDIQTCIEKGVVRGLEIDYVHADGTIVPIEISARVVESFGEPQLLALCSDITTRRQSEERRRQDALRTQSLLDLHKLSASLKGPELYNYVLEKAVELTSSEIGYIHIVEQDSDDTEIILTSWNKEALQECTASDDGHYPLEKAGIWADSIRLKKPVIHNDYQNEPDRKGCPEGHTPIVRHMSIPVIDDDKVKLVFGVGNKAVFYTEDDADQIQIIANELQKIIAQQRLAEYQDELALQLQQAQKMEAVGRLAGGVAHDFNNMLGVIIGSADLALDEVDPEDQVHADLVQIRKAAERSADLTRQLLAFARKQTISPRMINLNDTIASMLKMLQRLIGEDVSLVWVPGPDLWTIKMDLGQVDQILANMCINARDAVEQGGKITIETHNVELDELYCAERVDCSPGNYVVLAVSDNGQGMDAETRDSIFEPFFTTKGVGKGTGLGLSTVYGIIKQNHGIINVYSEPGLGTTFRMYFKQDEETTVVLTEETDLIAEEGGETILLVEDDTSLLEMMRKMLEKSNYRVLAISSPVKAVEVTETYKDEIDLLLTDVVMPRINGRDLARELTQRYPDLKTLYMSGYTANVIAHHGVLDEGLNFIEKPFSRKDLAAAIRKILDGGGMHVI